MVGQALGGWLTFPGGLWIPGGHALRLDGAQSPPRRGARWSHRHHLRGTHPVDHPPAPPERSQRETDEEIDRKASLRDLDGSTWLVVALGLGDPLHIIILQIN